MMNHGLARTLHGMDIHRVLTMLLLLLEHYISDRADPDVGQEDPTDSCITYDVTEIIKHKCFCTQGI